MKHDTTRIDSRAPRAENGKRYQPVREFERQTSFCPLYLAWHVVDEARDFFRKPIPEACAGKLARRAIASPANCAK
jgi:hypothetical protein